MGGLDTHDGLCRRLAVESGWAVLAVDYRLAPEHPYPAALDDLRAALAWLRGRRRGPARRRSGRRGRRLRRRAPRRRPGPALPRRRGPARRPVADLPGHRPGRRIPAARRLRPAPRRDALLLGRVRPARRRPRASTWTRCAPTWPACRRPSSITAELDVLARRGRAVRGPPRTAGVPVVAVRYQGLIHNFPRKLALFDAAGVAVAQIAAALSAPGFASGSTPG